MEAPRLWRVHKRTLSDLGKGEIFTFTKDLAIIELSSGKKVTAQLTDFDEEPTIGQSVECVTRKISEGDDGLIFYSYKFRPSFSSK